LIRLPGVARLVPEEAPETLSRILLEWMEEVEEAGGRLEG
jgi:hypothetical protein